MQNYQIRTKLELVNHTWYTRSGLMIGDVAPFVYELAKRNGQNFKARQADMYAAMFAQAAADLGDDGITFSAAKDLIGMPRIKRWWRDGRGVDFFDYHPMNEPYKNILSTTFTTVEEVRAIYEREDH